MGPADEERSEEASKQARKKEPGSPRPPSRSWAQAQSPLSEPGSRGAWEGMGSPRLSVAVTNVLQAAAQIGHAGLACQGVERVGLAGVAPAWVSSPSLRSQHRKKKISVCWQREEEAKQEEFLLICFWRASMMGCGPHPQSSR